MSSDFSRAPGNAGFQITDAQAKAARKLLGWSQERLAGRVGVGSTTILNFEKGHRMSVLDLTVMRQVLEAAGIEFTNGARPGVRLKERPRHDDDHE